MVKEYNRISTFLTDWMAKVDKIKCRFNISMLDQKFSFIMLTSDILYCMLSLQIQEMLIKNLNVKIIKQTYENILKLSCREKFDKIEHK